jgi:Type I restriction enzyme R protein N terminus (HSDR_N)
MTAKTLTLSPTEADLEAEIHGAIRKAFPWIPAGSLRHQVRFSVTLGHASIAIDAVQQLRAEGRADILVFWDQRPLCVFELKRKGMALTSEDAGQGLSYANLIRPPFPLVVVTNGEETRFLESHNGKAWQPSSRSEQEFENLVKAAASVAGGELKNAIATLMGSNPAVWMQGVRRASQAQLDALTGAWNEPLLPFVRGFLFPRKATMAVHNALECGRRLLLIESAPLAGKSSLLRELVLRTAKSEDIAVLFIPADEGSGILQKMADILAATLAWPVTADEARAWLSQLSRAQGPALVLAVDGVGPDHDRLRCELEDLSSPSFGPQLRLVVTADDAVAKQLVLHPNGRQASAIGSAWMARSASTCWTTKNSSAQPGRFGISAWALCMEAGLPANCGCHGYCAPSVAATRRNPGKNRTMQWFYHHN